MKKMNFYSKFASCCSWMLPVLAFLWSMNLQAQSCVGGSPTSPGANLTVTVCSGTGTAVFTQDVLVFNAGATSVNLYSLGGAPIANTGDGINPFIGKVIRAEAVNGGTVTGGITTGGTVVCWGYILLEDKTPPSIVCPANITLDCTQLGSVTDLDVTGEFNGATNRQGATGPTGSVVECSKYTQSYTDVVTVNVDCPTDGNVIRSISRTWTVKDVWGNTSAPCTQIITVTRTPRIAAWFRAAPVVGSCTVTDFSPTALNSWPYYDANNNLVQDANEPFIIIGASPICNVQNTGYTDQVLPLCNNGRKIIRTWTIVDMCQSGAAMIINVTQILTFTDVVPPTVSTTYQNYDQVTGTYCFNMYQNGTDMAMTQNTKTTKLLVPVTQAAGAVITLVPLADANTCNMATVRFTMLASDPTCGNNNVTFSSSDSRVRFNGGSSNAAVSVAGGSTVSVSATIMKSQGTTFSITVTDGCGNSTTQAFSVVIIDNVTPQTVCIERTRATLGSDGKVRIFASTFDNGSTDNCGIERIQVRRATRGASNTCGAGLVAGDGCFYDYVDFDCSDIGRTDIMVIVRAVDAAGNFSDCMVLVNVDDKTGPICMKPEDIKRFCTDPALSSYKALFTRPAAFDNCGVTLKDSTISTLALKCGTGTSTAIWTFQDCAGTTTTCSQVLTVNTVEGFRVKRICDSVSTCSATSNGLAIGSAAYDLWLKNKVIAEISLLNGVGVEQNSSCVVGSNNVIGGNIPPANGGCSPNGGTVAANQKTCSAPVVEIEKWQYSSSQYCQIFRYRITVLDFCNVRANYTSQLVYQGSAAQVQIGGIVGACTDATSYYQDDRGVVVFERFVYVNDQTAPVSTAPANVDSCIYAGCTFNYSTTLTATDNCGATGVAASDPSIVTYMWRAVNKATGAQIATGNTASVSLSNLAFGTYTICYRVSDLCGNMSVEYCYDVKGSDCKKPAVVCQNANAEIMPLGPVGTGGEIVVPLDDLLLWATDNCTLVKTYLQIPAGGKGVLQKKAGIAANGTQIWANLLATDSKLLAQGVKYVCSDASIGATVVDVQVWAEDFATVPNADFCTAKVTLQNNMGACTNFGAIFSVSGAARTESNANVNNVTVSTSVNGAAVSSATVANGVFNITMAPAANVQVRATKNNNDDAAQGVTTFDIAKVSQHVLDIEKFASPYQMIAADVDKSNEIDATDMLHMRRFILKITPSLPAGNFRFVDKAYRFRNAANPFGEDFPEVVNIAALNANTAANFVAIKLGDVNGSYSALAPRSSRTLSFLANDMNVVAGNEYTVNISADKLDAAAFQGTFSFNGATVKSVKAGNLNNMTDGNFGVFANAVTTSWNGKTQDASDVLAITFVANKSGKLSEMLTVNSALTQAVANDVAGNEMNVNLKFNTGKVAGGEFALYQNQPNPVANETTIGFNLPKDGQARLTITAVDGKVVKVLNGTYKAGYNTVTVNKSDLNASGVFYYRLETADHSASKKMVIIE